MHLGGDRARSSDDRIRPSRNLPRQRPLPTDVATPVRVRGDRVTEVCDPWNAHPPHRQADEVDRAGRRGGQNDVDPLSLCDAPGGRDRRDVPEHARVRQEQCTEHDRHLAPDARDAPQPVELLPGPSRRRADVPGPVDDDSLGLAQGVVALHPLRPLGRQHVDVEAEPRKLAGKLERTLDAGPARRWPVHRDEQELHCRPFWRRRPSPCIDPAPCFTGFSGLTRRRPGRMTPRTRHGSARRCPAWSGARRTAVEFRIYPIAEVRRRR